MALGDHYLITVRGEVVESSHPVQNAFVYEFISGAGDYIEMNLAWIDDMQSTFLALSTNHYHLISLYTVNLDDPDDFGETPIDELGSVDSAGLPSYDTWGFRLIRTTRAVQNGRKFIGLVPETLQDNGNPTAPAVTALTAMEVKLYANINDPISGATFSPRIWRRPGTYESGVVAAPGLFYPIGNAAFTKITTMKTRDDN